jgi:hypothetical protein
MLSIYDIKTGHDSVPGSLSRPLFNVDTIAHISHDFATALRIEYAYAQSDIYERNTS